MKKLILVVFLVTGAFYLHGQEPADGSTETPPTIDAQQSSIDMFGFHILTNEQLPSNIPYPFQGTAGDGEPDKMDFQLLIVPPPGSTSDNWLDVIERGNLLLRVDRNRDSIIHLTDLANPRNDMSEYIDREYSVGGNSRNLLVQGQIDLDFDIPRMMQLAYKAAFILDGEILDTYYTEIAVGNPELTIESTVKSAGMIMDRAIVTSVVTGRTGLVFDDKYQTLTGRGRLNYDEFRIDPLRRNCTVETNKKDGAWTAKVVFPTNLLTIETATETTRHIPAPQKADIFIEPNIMESAVIQCRLGIPPRLPLPKLIHFFSVFYSFHGGEIKVLDASDNRFRSIDSEMNEAGDAIEISGWEGGNDGIIGVKTYNRKGKRGKVTFEEETRFELRWPSQDESTPQE